MLLWRLLDITRPRRRCVYMTFPSAFLQGTLYLTTLPRSCLCSGTGRGCAVAVLAALFALSFPGDPRSLVSRARLLVRRSGVFSFASLSAPPSSLCVSCPPCPLPFFLAGERTASMYRFPPHAPVDRVACDSLSRLSDSVAVSLRPSRRRFRASRDSMFAV